eukprot:jgi/Phyca11/112505/e_gw1.22.557.1
MLQRLLHLQDALISFFSHIRTFKGQRKLKGMRLKLHDPVASDRLAMRCLTTLLGPFSTAIKALEPHKAAAGGGDYVDSTILMMNECRDTKLDQFNQRFLSD